MPIKKKRVRKNQAFYSSEILHVPKQSHFPEAKKGVTTWVCVTTWGVTTWRHYSSLNFGFCEKLGKLILTIRLAKFCFEFLRSSSLVCCVKFQFLPKQWNYNFPWTYEPRTELTRGLQVENSGELQNSASRLRPNFLMKLEQNLR